MARGTASTWGLGALLLTISLSLTGCMGGEINNTGIYKVGCVLVDPFLMVSEEGHGGKDVKYKGYIPDLFEELARVVGVRFKIVVQPDGKFGSMNADGRWDGLVGSLIRTNIDVAAGPLTITASRNRVVDFSHRFMSTGLVIVTSENTEDGPSPRIPRIQLIFTPFTCEAWFLVIVAVVIIVACVVIIHCINPREDKTPMRTQLTTCGSGDQYSGCVLRITVLLFVVMMVVLYAVTLRPAMVGPGARNHKHIDVATIASGLYKVAVVKDGSTQEFFRISTDPQYERINHMLTHVDNVTAGFELVHKDPKYAFVTERDFVDLYLQRQPCHGLNIVGEKELNDVGYGLALPLGSPLRDVVDLSILQLRGDGLLEKLQKKWWYSTGECGRRTAPGKKRFSHPMTPIDPARLGGYLIVLVIGLLLAVGVAIVERFLHLRSSKAEKDVAIA